MCVIIVKKPSIQIPFEKIDTACYVNNDGWGLSVLQDNNKLLTFKQFNPKGNDPQEIYDLMEKHKEHTQFLHLRYTTKGAKNIDNCHPFTLIDEDDYQLHLMHNGTLSFQKFDIPGDQSDTRAFCEQYAAPTAKAFYAIAGKDLMNNEPFIRMMDHFITSSWYFLLYDNLGNYRVLGGTGAWFDQDNKPLKDATDGNWWASNTYSFNQYHRQPQNYSRGHYYGGWMDNDEWNQHESRTPTRGSDGKLRRWDASKREYVIIPEGDSERKEESKESKDSTSTVSTAVSTLPVVTADKKEGSGVTSVVPFLTSQLDRQKTQCSVLGYALAEARRKGLDWASHTPPQERPTFIDLCDLNSLEEACVLNEEDIEELVGNYPEAAVLLIMDLLHDLYVSKRQQKDKAA